MFCSIVGGVCPWYGRSVDGIETPIKLETLVLLPGRGSAPVLTVSMMTSPGVPGREGWTISTETISPSSSSECSEDEAEERPPTMMNWDLLCERTRLM
jgi:hypothetical protein